VETGLEPAEAPANTMKLMAAVKRLQEVPHGSYSTGVSCGRPPQTLGMRAPTVP
jgi:hypothetical protein